jgi:lipopolysaccharide transport system ATP-binding protein
MSSEPEIVLEGVGKTFHPFAHPLTRLFSGPLAATGAPFSAVSGVDLRARRGDCVGIVGRNGAGKSTLLQIACGIMAPSAGRVAVRGRIAAMLQLGAGFDREFTGRQNVRLSAAIYGLDGASIRARMASIEEFAGIGDKIDRPVREYSSGMFARLAFAVCAHVDADILVVDEILGVGDAAFQQRSMRFLRHFRRKGIVLFVSHDEHAVSALCNRAIWIDAGRVVVDGPAKPVLRRYRQEMARLVAGDDTFFVEHEVMQSAGAHGVDASTRVSEPAGFDPDDVLAPAGGAEVVAATCNGRAEGPHVFAGGETIGIALKVWPVRGLERMFVVALLRNPMGQIVLELDSRRLPQADEIRVAAGAGIDCAFRFKLPYLPTGEYPLDVLVFSSGAGPQVLEAMQETALSLRVISSHVSGGLANLAMESVSFGPVAAEATA